MISVLYVNDELAELEIAKKYLEASGTLTITTASSAKDALKIIETDSIDAVVSDYKMPGMDGIGFLKAVRNVYPERPFILFTRKGQEDVVIEALNNKADYCLQKGSELDEKFVELQNIIISAVKKREKAFHSSELRYHYLFETARDGILILNADTGEIIDANPFILHLLGYSLEDLIGKRLWEIGFIKDKTKAEQGAIELKKSGYIRFEDLLLETKDGRSLEVEFVSNAYTVNHSKVIQCNIRDITESKQLEKTLKNFSTDLECKVIERTAQLSDINQKLVAEIGIRLEAEQKLTKILSAKEVLFREVHHRVKNNLQIIASLLNLQSRYITDEKTLAAIQESQNRVRAMALVHERIYRSTDISKINLQDYVKYLSDQLMRFHGISSGKVRIAVNISDIETDIDTMIPLGLLMNELVSNSFKHAFPDGRTGNITIRGGRTDGALEFRYHDDGIGIPESFDWRNADSLGLRLVVSLVEQLNGSIALEPGSGTTFRISVVQKHAEKSNGR